MFSIHVVTITAAYLCDQIIYQFEECLCATFQSKLPEVWICTVSNSTGLLQTIISHTSLCDLCTARPLLYIQCFSSSVTSTFIFVSQFQIFSLEFVTSFSLFSTLSSFPTRVRFKLKTALRPFCKLQDAALKFWIIVLGTVALLELQQASCPGSLLNVDKLWKFEILKY